MKFTKIFLFLIFSTLACCAQEKKNNMVIHQTDGSKVRYQTELIDSVTFEEGSTQQDAKPEVTVTKVYGDGATYCAFTSLVKRGDTYYLAFREAETHVGDGDYGVIKILYSTDGENWSELRTIALEQVDLRDPNLSVMPNGKLLLLCGARILSGNGVYATRTYRAVEKSNGVFDKPEPVVLPEEINWEACSWVWRLTWNNGIGYGVCYGGESPALLKTTDGYTYELVSYLTIPGAPSECRIRFKNDGTAFMLVRRDQGSTSIKGYWGKAKAPYTEWDWKELNVSIAGEDFLIDGNRIVIATRMTQNIGSWTALWFGNENGDFNWCYTLPYGCTPNRGETAYAGMINEPREYWISYYAIDEGEKPSIFMVKVPKGILAF